MKRCDFSSIMTIIRKYIGAEQDLTQVKILETIFSDFIYSDENIDYIFDSGAVCRWCSGATAPSPKIAQYYTQPGRITLLRDTIAHQLFPLMYDFPMAVREIDELFTQDSSVSDAQKVLIGGINPFDPPEVMAKFLADVLLFSLRRSFVKNSKALAVPAGNGQRSPLLRDFILGCEVPRPCSYFCGRDSELEQLHSLLQDEKKVFLHGIPGIGKSEVAKAYAMRHKKDYTNILYLLYSGDLIHDLAILEFINDSILTEEAQRLRTHLRFLHTLKEDTLLIVDNFNATAEQDHGLETMLGLSCRVLFTTRCRFEDHAQMELKEISDSNALMQLYAAFYDDTASDADTVQQIIETVHRHTLAVELSARLLKTGILNSAELLDKLKNESIEFDSSDLIGITKDKTHRKATYREHIHTLFCLFELSVAEQDLMRNMSLMPREGIDSRLAAAWLHLPNMNTINSLLEKGFLHAQQRRIILLHPMIQDVVECELTPTVKSCRTLLDHFHGLCLMGGAELPNYRQFCRTIESILCTIRDDDPDYFLTFLLDLLYPLDKYKAFYTLHIVNEIAGQLVEQEHVGSNLLKARVLFSKSQEILSDIPARIKMIRDAIHLLGPIQDENADIACLFYRELSHFCSDCGLCKEGLHYASEAVRINNDFHLGSFTDSCDTYEAYAVSLAHNGRFDEAWHILNELDQNILAIYTPRSAQYAELHSMMYVVALAQNNMELVRYHWNIVNCIYRELYADDPQMMQFWNGVLGQCEFPPEDPDEHTLLYSAPQ